MKKFFVFLSFLATIPLANFFIGYVGTVCVANGPCLIPVGFGLMAPSGVLFVGLALVLRDWLQELTNWRVSLLAVVLGSVVSLLTANPYVAMASAAAFLIAEVSDLLVYTPLREKGRWLAVLASGVVGALIDSYLFMWLAFGDVSFSMGLFLAKIYASALVAIYFYVRKNNAYKV